MILALPDVDPPQFFSSFVVCRTFAVVNFYHSHGPGECKFLTNFTTIWQTENCCYGDRISLLYVNIGLETRFSAIQISQYQPFLYDGCDVMDFHCILLCREKDIGMWLTVMKAMVYIGILTNCFILGFSSEQLMQWLPWLFTRNTVDGDQVMALGSGRYAGIYSDTYNIIILLATKMVSAYFKDCIISGTIYCDANVHS